MGRQTVAFITEGLENVLLALRFVQAASDAFPPLKSAVSGVIWIADSVKDFKANEEEWKEFADYAQQIVACIVSLVAKHERSASVRTQVGLDKPEKFLRCDSQHYNNALISLNKRLEEIQVTLKVRQEVLPKLWFRRYIASVKDRAKISELKSKLDQALVLFNVGSTIEAHNELAKGIDFIAGELKNISDQVTQLGYRFNEMEEHKNVEENLRDVRENISRLKGADIAPWDSTGTCLDGTRVDIVNDILGFASGSDPSFHDDVRILLITGVAGCGKTTIAETAMKRCEEAGILVSSFNFVAGTMRKTPNLLMATIARDLSRFHPDLEAKIGAAIGANPRIISASLAEQFRHLILQPLSSVTIRHRVFIIIDALDEGYDKYTLDILADACARLPPTCRLLITARPIANIVNTFKNSNHVVNRMLELIDERNRRDIALFARSELTDIGKSVGLNSSWPDDAQVDAFVNKAEGLFIWVVTVCNYIRDDSADPVRQLQSIIEDHQSNLPSEAKIEKLYSTILSKCPWHDPHFNDKYQLLLGTIVALKMPLSAVAIKSLLRLDQDVSVGLRWLSPVLSGLNSLEGSKKPLQILHPSFRRFVTQEMTKLNDNKFAIDEAAHSQDLALYSIRLVNEELPKAAARLLEISAKERQNRYQSQYDGLVSEELGYSCRFLVSHLETVQEPSQFLVASLGKFLETNLIAWMALCVLDGYFLGIHPILSWADNVGFLVWTHLDLEEIYHYLVNLYSDLMVVGRWEEALSAIDGVTFSCRELVKHQPAEYNDALTACLSGLSVTQVMLGQREGAVGTMTQTIDLYRALAKEQSRYKAPLSDTLLKFCAIQGLRHQWEECLIASREAVNLQRELAEDDLTVSNEDHALALNNLAYSLYKTSRSEEGLQHARQAITLQREVPLDGDSSSLSALADYLQSASSILSHLSEHEEALEVISECLSIYHKLVKSHPTRPDLLSGLAEGLHTKATCLSNCNQPEEALVAIREAVNLHRQVARDRPAAFNPDVAESLLSLANHLDNTGDHNEALQCVQEAVGLLRQLVQDEPEAFSVDFAESLDRLAVRLSALGREDEAANARREAQMVRCRT